MKKTFTSLFVCLMFLFGPMNSALADSNGGDPLIDIKLGNYSVEIIDVVGNIFLYQAQSIISTWLFGGPEQPPVNLSPEALAQIRAIVRGEVGNLLSDYQHAELKEGIRILGERLEDYKWSVFDGQWDEWTLESANEYSDYIISDLSFYYDPNINPAYWNAGSELMLTISLRLAVKAEMVHRDLRPLEMVQALAAEMKTMLNTMQLDYSNYFENRYPLTVEDNCYQVKWDRFDCWAVDEVFTGTTLWEAYYKAKDYHLSKRYDPFGGETVYNEFNGKLIEIIEGDIDTGGGGGPIEDPTPGLD